MVKEQGDYWEDLGFYYGELREKATKIKYTKKTSLLSFEEPYIIALSFILHGCCGITIENLGKRSTNLALNTKI